MRALWRPLAWLLTALAALLLYLMENNGGTRALLIAAVLLPVCSALPLLPRPKLTVRLEVPEALVRDEPARCALVLANSSPLPLSQVRCGVEIRNLLTGENFTLPLSARLGPRKVRRLEFTLTSAHCGQLSLRVTGLRLTGSLGLFARPVPCQAGGQTLVPPVVSPVALSLADGASSLQDSAHYSAQRPGYDPSETFRIREYLPGDPVRQIHWKLSQKTGTVLVRDFGLPVADRLLILLETTSIPGGDVTAEDLDLMLDLLSSLSQALLALEIPHRVGWRDGASGAYVQRSLEREEDWPELLSALLASPAGPGEDTVADCCLQRHPQCAWGHVALLSPYVPPGLSELFRGSRVTVLSPQREGSGSGQEQAVLFTASGLRSGSLFLEL